MLVNVAYKTCFVNIISKIFLTSYSFRKKEKMSHCNMVADNICSQAGVKNNTDFSKYLTVATDMFFTLSNDEDADIRLLAGK